MGRRETSINPFQGPKRKLPAWYPKVNKEVAKQVSGFGVPWISPKVDQFTGGFHVATSKLLVEKTKKRHGWESLGRAKQAPATAAWRVSGQLWGGGF